ncbi:Alpha/Beta hydrolase protein [Cladorrhinum samala]|uniref:Alpha/Beta hydrolase protein n=1 Tax=Cladorrhinum samala TaxID=585594 RepID=A0AAV9HK56_9PEZI|nr:Alpha/Beta hydrolase protein [Cladorrhinum samala]
MRAISLISGAVAHSFFAATTFRAANAQFPPEREGVTVIESKFYENVTISFKEPGICETTPGVRSYSGYVHLPPRFLEDEEQDYPINTFFWFFEARKDPKNAPLAIWLNGGPGSTSMMAVLEENGPCFVASDSKTTYLNPWSWNNEVNMLYIDQPVGAGFSYDILTNVTLIQQIDELGDSEPRVIPTNFTDGKIPTTNYTHRIGTTGSQDITHTSNTTERAAHATWHFLQTWLFEFPHYKPKNDRISLWAESYGGHYGPGFFRFFQEQNEKIEAGTSDHVGAQPLHLDTLGIVNGVVDWPIAVEACFDFPYNNTYGLQFFNQSFHSELVHNWTDPGGWKDQLMNCTKRVTENPYLDNTTDPECVAIQDNILEKCFTNYVEISDRAQFDVAHPRHDPFPPPYYFGYLTQSSVLAALGVPVNHTSLHYPTNSVFTLTLDPLRPGFLDSVGYLLDAGIKVHFMYGDRDAVVNWVGGEKTSLSVPHKNQNAFRGAGYAPLVMSDGKSVKGMTRQHANFSFTRVFQAGHEVPAYQPEAAYEIFMRAMLGKDVPTGRVEATDEYATHGPSDAWGVRQEAPELPEPKCYVLKPETCEPGVWKEVVDGKAKVKDWFVVGGDEEKEEENEKNKTGREKEVGIGRQDL